MFPSPGEPRRVPRTRTAEPRPRTRKTAPAPHVRTVGPRSPHRENRTPLPAPERSDRTGRRRKAATPRRPRPVGGTVGPNRPARPGRTGGTLLPDTTGATAKRSDRTGRPRSGHSVERPARTVRPRPETVGPSAALRDRPPARGRTGPGTVGPRTRSPPTGRGPAGRRTAGRSDRLDERCLNCDDAPTDTATALRPGTVGPSVPTPGPDPPIVVGPFGFRGRTVRVPWSGRCPPWTDHGRRRAVRPWRPATPRRCPARHRTVGPSPTGPRGPRPRCRPGPAGRTVAGNGRPFGRRDPRGTVPPRRATVLPSRGAPGPLAVRPCPAVPLRWPFTGCPPPPPVHRQLTGRPHRRPRPCRRERTVRSCPGSCPGSRSGDLPVPPGVTEAADRIHPLGRSR